MDSIVKISKYVELLLIVLIIFLFYVLVTLDVIMKLCQFIDDWCRYFGLPEAIEVNINKQIFI